MASMTLNDAISISISPLFSPYSHRSSRRLPPPSSPPPFLLPLSSSSSAATPFPTTTLSLSSSSSSTRSPLFTPSNTNTNTNTNTHTTSLFNSLLSHPLSKSLIISAPTGFLLFLLAGGGNGIGIGIGGGGGGGNGGSGGSWWSRFIPAAALANDNDNDKEWEPHGLPANIIVQLNKISDILFYDQRLRNTVSATHDSFEMLSLGVYTKAQLQKELETLATSGMFEKVDLVGSINLTL